MHAALPAENISPLTQKLPNACSDFAAGITDFHFDASSKSRLDFWCFTGALANPNDSFLRCLVVGMTPFNRTSLYRQFADRFRPAKTGCRVVPVTHLEIDAAERILCCKLPTSYRTFVTEVGAGDNDEPDDSSLRVAEIWQPELIVRQVRVEWRAPIPGFLTDGTPIASAVAWKHLTPFASEQSHGFWFCFPHAVDRFDDAPVFFFNHDGGDIERVADGFDDMIRRLLSSGPATR